MPSMEKFAPESLGQRIGVLRARQGWTQADLAGRVAVSRVAISHFEMGLALPSERTVVLLAGLFKLTPLELVVGTDYPAAKRERLPATAPLYTEVELQIALLERDLGWLGNLQTTEEAKRMATELAARWAEQLAKLEAATVDAAERRMVREAGLKLQQTITRELRVAISRPS